MKAKRFIVAERPRLAAIAEHPKVAFAEYEQQLSSMQFTVQASNKPISEHERGR